jgi:hypothetical protein
MIHSSLYWKNHFENNLTRLRINWSVLPMLNDTERKAILYSLCAWQLGETSDGKHLLATAARYARRHADPGYLEAVRLFISEEQKHGENLGRYIDAIGEKRLHSDWGDSLFRKIRYFNTSMELWTITVIIVESAAQVFYQALHDATGCPLLRSICNDILVDEAHHIKFQNERLAVIFGKKRFYARAISLLAYSILFFGTIHAIWFGHRRALKAGGLTMRSFMQDMYYRFFRSMQFLHKPDNSVLQAPGLEQIVVNR